MAEQALYRKYRSANFDEVIGQEHVVRTLVTAIASGRLSHAYLFTGPRGVGKTSVARLLARALNCTGEPKPCNQCANCRAAIGSSLDVVEIDAASNRSIDAVRDLREKVSLAPTQGQYKVYIIDEVHMLTTEAFNALLKTLEEPPAHAVFILATTEAHKLPETIISRTQRFNFKPHTTANIVAQLGKIATTEDIGIEPGALELIASTARGGFRDAISMLDQLAASGAKPITAETVRSLLGYSDAEQITALSAALVERNAQAGLEVMAQLDEQGAQAGQITLQLTEQWRSILLATAGMPPAGDPITAKLAQASSPAHAAAVVETLLEVSRSHWPALALEAAIVKLTLDAATPVAPAPRPVQVAPSHTAKTATKAPDDKPASTKTAAEPTADSTPGASSTPSSTSGPLAAALWPKVLVIVKSQNNSLCALLQMYPVDFSEEEIVIKPRFNFHRDLFTKPLNRSMIEAAAAKVYGRPVKISARTEDTGQPKASRAKAPQPDPNAELISSALEILGGEIVD